MKKKNVALKYLSVVCLFAGLAFLAYSAVQFIHDEIQSGTSSLTVGLRHAIVRESSPQELPHDPRSGQEEERDEPTAHDNTQMDKRQVRVYHRIYSSVIIR